MVGIGLPFGFRCKVYPSTIVDFLFCWKASGKIRIATIKGERNEIVFIRVVPPLYCIGTTSTVIP
jgi:hypothetical protein